MSYDVEVYTAGVLDAGELVELVAGAPGLAVGDHDEASGWYAVVRGAQRRHCFTVDGPVPVEPEDVPEEVTAAGLGLTHLYRLGVEGSAPADVPHALRLARRLAQALGGVVLDQQTGDVWARGASRVASTPQREERVSEVELDWYCLRSALPADVPERYGARCRQLLPEALPRRFGEHEPLGGTTADVGLEGFVDAWRAATGTLCFAASKPCLTGSMAAGPADRYPAAVWHLSLSLLADPVVDDARWRQPLRALLVALAEDLGAFYASAQLCRDRIWSGRSMWTDASSEWPVVPARADGWDGLPPYPVSWAWYGGPYAPLVDGRLRHGEVTTRPAGLLHVLSDQPVDRDRLVRRVSVRRGLRRRAEWAPQELLAVVGPDDGSVAPVPLRPARVVPVALA